MCGLAGLLRLPGSAPLDDPGLLSRMADSLEHRGPDARGHRWFGPCGLAHTRLAVIDTSAAGNQPMVSACGDHALAYNGEIYDFAQLAARGLGAASGDLRSGTDTEVLLELLARRGADLLPELDGIFAFAAWDRARRRLLLARDPWGVKPLFYRWDALGLAFASEIKALLELPGAARRPSAEALFHFLSFDYVPGAQTAFEGILELEPGWALEVDAATGEHRLWRWHRPRFDEDPSIGAREATETCLELLDAAVRRQLVADVPVGVMLSGGMDSSALAALVAKQRGPGFHTFSLAFDAPSYDESRWAALVARSVGSRHHEIRVTPERVADTLWAHTAHIDEPYADGAAIPTWLLTQQASRHVTVLLSGEGGDEIFAGYDTHAAWKARALYRRLCPGPLRRRVLRPLARRLPVSERKLGLGFKARRFTTGAEHGVARSHFHWRHVLSEGAKAQLLTVPGLAAMEPSWSLFERIWDEHGDTSELNRLLAIDLRHHLADDLMIKNDRMTMAWSVEARVPFTDRALVRYLERVPARIKMPGLLGGRKRLLRDATRGLLPDAIRTRPKLGLEMPYGGWLRRELRELAGDLLLVSAPAEATGLLRQREVERLWREHQAGRADHGRALWGLLSFMVWHGLYIDAARWREHRNPGRTR